ncbi:MAG: hypothetical protein KDD24_09240, partial [Flavobacteriales bacterium]|nr:hypothetical protein [Flavobacteriales bacterium]
IPFNIKYETIIPNPTQSLNPAYNNEGLTPTTFRFKIPEGLVGFINPEETKIKFLVDFSAADDNCI